MPNSIGPTGLTLATQSELVQKWTDNFEGIYGTDINLDPDSPDGQMMNLFVQSVLDLQDLVQQVYNMFDPDNAIGIILDQRVAINGIQRQAGTFTITNITIVASQACNLYGLDQSDQPIYTVQDASGNQWQLQTTQTISGSGTYAFSFQAATPGANITTPNTINIPVTIVLGVTSVNNPTSYTTLGLNEETDAALKIRRQQSVSLSSQGWVEGLYAALKNINGVTSVFIKENTTATTDANGIPGHSIWAIVAGSGTSAQIAQAIYTKRNAGCGMKGSQSFNIAQPDGSSFTVNWDTITTVNLFIKFTATSLDGVNAPQYENIENGLVIDFVPDIAQEVNINALATAVQDIDPNCLVTSAGFSTSAGGSYSNTLTPSVLNDQFVVLAINIIILPILVTPATISLVHTTGTTTFTSVGGHGTIAWMISTNNSGGSIDSSTGVYTAGSTHPVADTITATDSLGNASNATVSVT